MLTRAEALDVPIYIHPNWASPQVMDIYYNSLGNEWVSRVLSGAGHGWHQEVALRPQLTPAPPTIGSDRAGGMRPKPTSAIRSSQGW